MRQFYLGKTSSGYYKAYFIDPVTGLRDYGKSTHTKDKIEAVMIATSWLQNGIPCVHSNSRFLNSSDSKSFVSPDLKSFVDRLSESDALKVVEMISKKFNLNVSSEVTAPDKETMPEQKIKLCSFLMSFWDYDSSEFIKRYVAHGHSISKKHTLNMQAFVRNYWLPYFGEETCIEDLDRQMLDDFFFYLNTEKGLSGETTNKVINSCSRPFKWLFDNGKIKVNPTVGIERFKADNAKRDIPTEQEFRDLLALDWNNYTAKLAFRVSAFYGLRAGEISGLRVCDVDPVADILHVRHSWCEIEKLKSTKNKDTRDIPIDHQTAIQLINLARQNPNFGDESFIFFAPHNPSEPFYPGYYGDIFYEALDKIGVHEEERKERNIVFHSLRHFCATYLRQRADVEIVQSIMGHRTVKMSEHYADHETQEKIDNMRNAINEAWSKYMTA